MSPHQILIVEAHDATRQFVADQLVADGYDVLIATNRDQALDQLATHHPALVLADLNGHTLSLLDAVRDGAGLAGEIDPATPMIVLTAHADELARVRVFDRGGDDVVTKPFSYPELRGRIRALLRRAHEPRPAPAITRLGCLAVDHRSREVRVSDQRVELSAKEFALLGVLVSDPTRVFTREELLREVWGYPPDARTRTLDSHASRLRKTLAAADPGRRLVINVWGVGYRLSDREATL
jgi:DNA-binding response OmpR family regulator